MIQERLAFNVYLTLVIIFSMSALMLKFGHYARLIFPRNGRVDYMHCYL